jgi:hypothetical protein
MEDATLKLTKAICRKLKYEPLSIDPLFRGYRARLCIVTKPDRLVSEFKDKLNKLDCRFVKVTTKKMWWKRKWIISIIVPFKRK